MSQRQKDHREKSVIHSTIRMLIPLGKQSEAIDILGSICAQTQCEPDCISAHLYRGVDDVRAIMVEERWTSNEHILQHLQSDAYRRILMVVEMAEEPPKIRFDKIEHSSGVEMIEKARREI
ncbi:putative quinol monooxygenase [Desulfosarcina variabilis]|uniref:putative quinol monooxygenase n=1 Tax=Desulfosarcina variabilis TaxID=2300 RepID=UPI003AFB1416